MITNRGVKLGVALLIGGSALVLLFFFWLGGGFITEKRNKYFIPLGYVGWGCVAYAVPGAPPLATDSDGFQIVRVSDNGIVKTSTPGKPGPLIDVYYQYGPDGKTVKMPTERMGGGGTFADPNSAPGVFASYFWVSDNPKSDYSGAGSPSSDSLRGRCF